MKIYSCYVIASHDFKRTYAGVTTELDRRLRQHDGILRGGAKATRGFGVCQLLFVVNGFGANKRDAMRMEWRLKEHPTWKAPNSHVGVYSHIQTRQALLQKAMDWASQNIDYELTVVYGLPSRALSCVHM